MENAEYAAVPGVAQIRCATSFCTMTVICSNALLSSSDVIAGVVI